MEKHVKQVSAFLALAITASVCGACANTSAPSGSGSGSQASGSSSESLFHETGLPITSEKVTQSMIIRTDTVYADGISPDMYFFKEMEKRTNVNFEFEKLSPDQWSERKNLMFASNELPDILIGELTNSDVITYSKANQLLALNDLIEKYAPDYQKHLSQFPSSAKLYAPDGKMYGFVGTFTGGTAETPGARAFINKGWLDKLGLSMPQAYDEFYSALTAFRDQDPDGNGTDDTIPLGGYSSSGGGGYTIDCFVAGPLGLSFGWSSKDRWQIVDDKVVFVSQHPQYKAYVENMRKLYREKLLDQEYYTQNDAQMKAKGENLLYGAYTYAAHFVLLNTTDPAVYGQYVVPAPLTSDVFPEKVWYGDNVGSANIFLTSANQHPEISVRYLNEIFTDDAAELLVGPEDGQWDGQGGRVWNSDKTQFTYNIPEGYNGVWEWICKEIAPVQCFQGYMQFSDIKAKEQKTPEDAAFKDGMEQNVAPYLKSGFPTLFFTPEELEQVSLIQTSVDTYFEQMEAKIIMGEEPLESLDTMNANLDKDGLEQLTTVYNTAYERYKANVK